MVRRIIPIFAVLVALVVSPLSAGSVGFGVAPASAKGGGPEKAFNGKVMLSAKRYPTSAKSPAAYTAAVRKQSTTKFQEDQETQTWTIYMAAFLKKPVPDVEVTIQILDPSKRPAMLVTSFDQFLDSRGQRTIISSFKLDRKVVGVNRRLTIQVMYGKTPLATGTLEILGKAVVYSGKVDFSDEESK